VNRKGAKDAKVRKRLELRRHTAFSGDPVFTVRVLRAFTSRAHADPRSATLCSHFDTFRVTSGPSRFCGECLA
jgi:hypothetical protein